MRTRVWEEEAGKSEEAFLGRCWEGIVGEDWREMKEVGKGVAVKEMTRCGRSRKRWA